MSPLVRLPDAPRDSPGRWRRRVATMTDADNLPARALSGPAAKPPVMADVARAAGVSHQTVSRVLNHHPSVRPETRERVLAAITELDYRRNLSARALVTRRTQTVGVISFDTTLFGPASTLYALQLAARRAGYFVSVASMKTINRKTIAEAYARLAEQNVDGVIVLAPLREAAEALNELPRDRPLVAFDGGGARDFAVVCVDQVAGASLATQHLLSQGAPTVWHVAGPSDWLEAEERVQGWRSTLERAGVEVPEMLRGDWSPQSGYSAGGVLAQRDDVAAVFVANDQMALGVLRAFHEHGVRVPQDVLLVGFDDIPEAAFFTPPLTTVQQGFAEVGERCIEQLLLQIAGEDAPYQRVVIDPHLVVRQSSVGSAGR
jgi:DNA-binding LacI/PurR family transcriptional regulator